MFDAEAAHQMISDAVSEIEDLRMQLVEQDKWMREQMGAEAASQERVDYLEGVLEQARKVSDARNGLPTENLMMLTTTEEVKRRWRMAMPISEDEQRHLIQLLNYADDLARAVAKEPPPTGVGRENS